MKQTKIPRCEPVTADERMQRELDRHRRIERAFGQVLVAQDRDVWQWFSDLLRARLSREEAAALVWAAVVDHVTGKGQIAAEYVEIESGKRNKRPQLARAMAEARRIGAVQRIRRDAFEAWLGQHENAAAENT